MTALDRRLQQIQAALSPTEAVVRWLEEAKGYGSYAAYSTALREHAARNPYTSLPSAIAAGHPAHERIRVEGAVRSALVRVSLVERLNGSLIVGLPPDLHQIDLLGLLEPLVLAGRVDVATDTAYLEHAGRLVDEARLWQAGAGLLASRYFAGHDPLFPDIAASLDSGRRAAEALLAGYNVAASRTRARKPKGEPVDLTLIDQHVGELLEAHTAELLRVARIDTEVFLGERARQTTIARLMDLREEG